MKIYITFGQVHAHRVNGTTFDKDSVAEIECKDSSHGRNIAFELFGPKFMTHYTRKQLDDILHFFPRGIFKAN